MNENHYKRYWIAVLIVSLITSLLSCSTVAEVYDAPMYLTGCVYSENDTIVNGDTLQIWRVEE